MYCWYSNTQAKQPEYNYDKNNFETFRQIDVYKNKLNNEVKCTYISSNPYVHGTTFRDMQLIGEVIQFVKKEKIDIKK